MNPEELRRLIEQLSKQSLDRIGSAPGPIGDTMNLTALMDTLFRSIGMPTMPVVTGDFSKSFGPLGRLIAGGTDEDKIILNTGTARLKDSDYSRTLSHEVGHTIPIHFPFANIPSKSKEVAKVFTRITKEPKEFFTKAAKESETVISGPNEYVAETFSKSITFLRQLSKNLRNIRTNDQRQLWKDLLSKRDEEFKFTRDMVEAIVNTKGSPYARFKWLFQSDIAPVKPDKTRVKR